MTALPAAGNGAFLVPAVPTPTSRALCEAAARRGLRVVPLSLATDPAQLTGSGPLHFYGGPLLARHVRGSRSLALLEPADDWLSGLPGRFLRRRVRIMSALEAYGLEDRWFIKMPSKKTLEPALYRGYELPSLPTEEPLLVSEAVEMTDEWRFWILDGEVRAASSYRRDGRPEARPFGEAGSSDLARFMDDLLADQAGQLPSAVVVDVAWIARPDPGWAVVEANMAWFSSIYASDPSCVLDVVLRAAGPPTAVAARDARFLRDPAA